MAKVLDTNATVSFADLSNARSGIKLEEDADRPVVPTVFYPELSRVTAKTKTYVKMFHGAAVNPTIQALTGTLVSSGEGVDKNVIDLLVFTPDIRTVNVPAWAENIRVRLRGVAFNYEGGSVSVSATYNPVSHAVSISQPAFAVAEVLYDAPYRLYLYHFAGTCPMAEPRKYDETGNELISEAVNYFDSGVIVAYDGEKNVHATLQLQQPECTWGTFGVGVRGTEVGKVLPRLYMDVHPDYPPRLVSSGDGAVVWCECTIRIFPANAANVLYATSGSATLSSITERMDVEDVLFFNNESSTSLTRTPATDVSLTKQQLYVVDTLNNSFQGVGLDTVRLVPPLRQVTDVEYTGRGTYVNPTSRTLGPDEVCAVDRFNIPTKVLAVVTARYSATYSCAVFTFGQASGSAGWKPATLVARAPDGRVARVELSPPSLKSRTRKFADG